VVNRNDSAFVETWETFHDLVNMTSPELRDFLMNTPDGADTYAPEPDIDIHALGLQVLQIKQKRRVDITESDMGTMQEVIDLIEGRLQNAPESDIQDDPWRDTLMTLGHDPTRPDSPRGEDAEV
jgi:Protein of unknown function (DUF3140)